MPRIPHAEGLVDGMNCGAALVVIKKMVSAMTAGVCPTLCGNERTDAIANYGTDDKGHH
jgi:hypothetical protein